MPPRQRVDRNRHPLLDSVLKLMETRGPHVSILGPYASGKTKLLESLIGHLRLTGFDQDPCLCLHLDLRKLIPEPPAAMWGQILEMVRVAGDEQGIRVASSSNLDEALRELANQVNGLLFFAIDHLDDAPFETALNIVQHLRGLKEESEDSRVRAKVGLLVSGSVSLYRLRRRPQSGLVQTAPFALPTLDSDLRKRMVRSALGGRRVEEDALELLAAETGGEDAFLAPVLTRLGRGREFLKKEQVGQTIREIPFHTFPVVRRLLTGLLCNQALAEVALDVSQGKHRSLGVQSPDVHPYQLEGALIADWSRHAYEMRNGIVASLVRELGEAQAVSPVAGLRAEIARLLDVRALPQRILLADDLRSATPFLLRAWEVTTPEEWARPRIHLAVRRGAEPAEWFELTSATEPAGETEKPAATEEADKNACCGEGRAFAWDAGCVAYSVAGRWRDLDASLTVTAAKDSAHFTETGLGHWTEFARRAVPSLIRQAATMWGARELPEAVPASPVYDIFLSHSSVDRKLAEEIRDKAVTLNLRVFFSALDLQPGLRFSEELREALVQSNQVWLLASEASLKSVWVHTEWGAAWVLRKTIVPVLYRVAPKDLPDRLQELHVVDLHQVGQALSDLAHKLNRLAKGAGGHL